VIPRLFNVKGFGPPLCVTTASTCPRVDHTVSRLTLPTISPYSGSLSLRLLPSTGLTLPETLTRRLIMQKARRHPDKSGLRPLVSVWFQVLFHSVIHGSFHLSLTVLVHYRSLRSI